MEQSGTLIVQTKKYRLERGFLSNVKQPASSEKM
jgi:hypothetical protein